MVASDPRPSLLRLVSATLLVVGLAAIALWAERAPVTDVAVRRYLAANGVDAAAETVAVGRHQLVFDHVRLGPRAAPDLTARRIVIDLSWSAFVPAVAGVRLDGAALRVRADASDVSFGSLDKLIPPGRSTRFPALRVDAADAAILLMTPVGTIDARIDASGRLDRDFKATGQVAPVTLRWGGCVVTVPDAHITMTTVARDFNVTGQGRLLDATCRGAAAPAAKWQVAVAAPLALTRLAGKGRLTAATASAVNTTFAGVALDAALEGPPAALHGRWNASLAGLVRGPDLAERMIAAGTLTLARGSVAHVDATVATRGVRPATVIAMLPPPTGLPTLAAKLVTLAGAALQRVDVTTRVSADFDRAWHVQVADLDAAGAGGATLHLTGSGIDWTDRGIGLGGRVTVRGGGLPAIDFTGTGTASGGRGTGSAGPWRDGSDALLLTGSRFDVTTQRIAAAGTLRLSSGLRTGRVDGLTLPLSLAFDRATGVLAFGEGCLHAGFDHASVANLQLSATSVKLCPAQPGPLARLRGRQVTAALSVDELRLRGVAGARAFAVSAGPFKLNIGGSTAAPVVTLPDVDLAAASEAWRGNARVSASAALTPRGWSGEGMIGALRATGPSVIATGGQARWRLATGVMTADGASFTLTDPRPVPAFNPLELTGLSGQLTDQILTARTTIGLAHGATLAMVTGRYDLARRTGRAELSSTLTFSPTLQPLDISGLARGLVANVAGTVTSAAALQVAGDKVTGTGTLRLAKVALATAALGPVTGIDGIVTFDDLAALHTPPHQMLHIAGFDPGVAVADIAARFQLLGRDAVAIERVTWPFTGGTMTVRPTVLRTGIAQRSFTVDVEGLDAEQFLQRFQIMNLNATGKFDGVLPLVFERSTGRIAGGVLTARSGGGLLQYVGEVGQASMGTTARLAFDALRRLRYRTLMLRLDGDLDGEIVTAIDFTGINEAPLNTGNRLPLRATGLPFKFGMTVRAPFRALLGTAASFSDARTVIHAAKPSE